MEEKFDLSGSFPLEWSRRRWDLSLSDAHHLWKIWKWHLMQRNYMVKGFLWPVAVGGCRPSPHIYTDIQLPKVPFLPSITGITLGASGPAGPGRKSVRKRGMEQEGGASGLRCVFKCYRAFWNIQSFYFTFIIKGWNKWRRSYACWVPISSQPIKTQACVLRPRVNLTFDGWPSHAQQSSAQLRLSKLSWMRNERNLSHSSTALKNWHLYKRNEMFFLKRRDAREGETRFI